MDIEEVGDGGTSGSVIGSSSTAPGGAPRSRCRRSAKYLLTFGHGYMVVRLSHYVAAFRAISARATRTAASSCKLRQRIVEGTGANLDSAPKRAWAGEIAVWQAMQRETAFCESIPVPGVRYGVDTFRRGARVAVLADGPTISDSSRLSDAGLVLACRSALT